MNNHAQSLHDKALKISQNYHRAEADLIAVLQEIDETRAYLEFRYRSLFEYATLALRLSGNVAYNLITVARKAQEVPELREKIQAQELTLSNARMIAPLLTPENQERWIHAAQVLSKRQLEKEIARERPELMEPERMRYVREDRVRLELNASEELFEALKRAQDIVSSKTGKPATLEDTLQAMVSTYLERHDPIEKAQRAQRRGPKSEPVPGRVKPKLITRKRALPARLKHALALRDRDQCTHRDPVTGERCRERRWLDHHHIVQKSAGGEDRLENLATLCKGHHQMLHRPAVSLDTRPTTRHPTGQQTP